MQAIVLKRQDFRNYDQTITFYTKEQGKLSAVARGVKKIMAKNASALEPLSLLEVEIIPGKGVQYVGTVAVAESFAGIRRELSSLLVAQSALLLVNTLIVGPEKDEAIFALLVDFLQFLNGGTSAQNVLDQFVLQLIGCLGFAPPDARPTHDFLLTHVRYHTSFPVADWNSYQTLLA